MPRERRSPLATGVSRRYPRRHVGHPPQALAFALSNLPLRSWAFLPAIDVPRLISLDMGRIFEVRKHTMFARWNRMAKQFARIAKDINMAVKAGGSDPTGNPALRRAVQNARAVNMPKDKVEAA